MEKLYYSITLAEVQLQIEQNNLGYCFNFSHFGHTDVFIHETLDKALDMMEYVMDYLI